MAVMRQIRIVRYSMEGMEHTLRISGSIAKNLGVLIVAVMKLRKDQGKDQSALDVKGTAGNEIFHHSHDRSREFAGKPTRDFVCGHPG